MKMIRMIDNYITDKKFSIIFKNNSLNVINYSEICDFSSTKISIRYDNKIYNIVGYNLVISKMMENEILIIGDICNISFV